MDGWMDGWTDGQTDGWTDRQMDGWMDGWINHEQMDWQTNTSISIIIFLADCYTGLCKAVTAVVGEEAQSSIYISITKHLMKLLQNSRSDMLVNTMN